MGCFTHYSFEKLLFIQGHNDTGLEHINKRHRYYTNEHSPVKGGFIITSRFAPDSGILEDYTRLSEFLFDQQFKVHPPKNKRPDLFDVYQAKVEFKGRSEFCLILYKDSTIVHTMFPIEKNKKVKKYKKQNFRIEYSEPGFIRGVISYTDSNNKVRFALGIIMDMIAEKEILTGLVYQDETLHGSAKLAEIQVKYPNGYEWRIEALNCADLSNMKM